jgi:hypothetical protein
MSGYSGTPLAKKLGIKPGSRLAVSGAPKNYADLLAPLPEGVRFERSLGPGTDIAHVFATQRAKLGAALREALRKMKPDAAIWVSWPKKAAKVHTDITEDTIREIALPMGLVDIKVCAVDETWSGLKLVLRKENRK